MSIFTMNRYMNQYAEAVNRLNRMKVRIEGLREAPLYAGEEEGRKAREELRAAEAEYEALKAEVDNLWCLANTGRPRGELEQAGTFQPVRRFGGFHAHWPESPRPGRLP